MGTWREIIEYALEGDGWRPGSGEKLEDLVFHREDFNLDREFDFGYGGVEGEPFTAWGPRYVYFPVCYDGAESVGFAPRNPCDEATGHWGGG